MLDQLDTASFKGVRFACNDTTTTVGRAKIKHEFANSNKNNIEDQGLIPRVYQLTAIITGENYKRDRDQLLSTIETEGSGVLIHPFYGRIENVEALPVTYSETMKRLGRIEIPITFEISDSEGIPAVTRASSSGITSRKETLIAAVANDFSNTFSVTNSFAGNFQAAQDKANSFADSLAAIVTVTGVARDVSAAFRSKLDAFSRNINTLIGLPVEMATSVTGLVNDISGLYDTAVQTLDVARRLFSFGDDDTPLSPTTAGLIERISNNEVFNRTVQASALGVGYESASLIEFKTVDAVDTTSRALEVVYVEIKASDMNQESLKALDEIRVDTQQLLNDQKLSAATVVTKDRNTRPVRLLSFDYYGDSSSAEDLIDLNKNINVSYFEGDIKVLTQ